MEEQAKVRVDWFIADVANIEISINEELMRMLIGTAVEYIMVNGALPWEKWSLLSATSRAAFTAAVSQIKTRESLDIPS